VIEIAGHLGRQGRHDAASEPSVKSKMAVFPRKTGIQKAQSDRKFTKQNASSDLRLEGWTAVISD
jgi:hypothetical protein